jgi:hypothetical protein
LPLAGRSYKAGAFTYMKYSQWIGTLAALVLISSGFMAWTYHPDIDKIFTGFFSENNVYGKPGKVFIFFSILAIVFFLTPRLWAKRWNLLICAMALAYAFKSFILFSGCYRGICPEKKYGLWIMLFSAAVMMVAALLPQTKRKID